MPKYIFIDTFALDQLTKEHYDALSLYLRKHELIIVITPILLVEYFSPMLQKGDRTENAVLLLMQHHFVISNQNIVMHKEEAAYPTAVPNLPIDWSSTGVLEQLNIKERYELLYKLFHYGIPDGDFNLKEWADNYHQVKKTWKDDVSGILLNAMFTGALENKEAFVQSLDLRLCNGLEVAIKQSKGEVKKDYLFDERKKKLDRIHKKKDTRIMKGIHLSSLIIWYDYVIANKKIKDSDLADIYHSINFPYCDVVITDASRVDAIQKIQKQERLYQQMKCFSKREFLKELQQ